MTGTFPDIVCTLNDPLYDTFGADPFPFFVVIRITPLEALDPYIAAAEASFSTENDSMSFGFSRSSGLDIAPPAPCAIGTPSITISGSFEAFSEAAPRMRMREPEPGPPSPGVTSRPGTFPLSMSCVFTTAPRLRSSAFIAETEPVRSSFFTVPYPTTTTSSRYSESSFNVTVAGICDAWKVCVMYPTQLISTGASGLDTVSEKLPSSPVEVPFEVPCSTTAAPMTGPKLSTTVPPAWYPPCANDKAPPARRKTSDTTIFLTLSI